MFLHFTVRETETVVIGMWLLSHSQVQQSQPGDPVCLLAGVVASLLGMPELGTREVGQGPSRRWPALEGLGTHCPQLPQCPGL